MEYHAYGKICKTVSDLKGGCALIKILIKTLSENLRLILTGMIFILMIMSAAVVVSLYFGGDTTRQLTVTEINGSAFFIRDGRKISVSKNTRLKSGDILETEDNASVRISIDGDKFVFVEPNTSMYIYCTDIASKGDIAVNLSQGAVICEINSELKKNSSFVLKTPNSTASVKGTVFRAQFDVKNNFMDSSNVMVTEYQNFDGTINLQLYDSNGEPFELPMVLVERTSAQMITSEELCKYGYLNYDINLISLSETTLHEILRAQNAKEIGFSSDEINLAYKSAVEENRRRETITDITEFTEETTVTTTTTASTPTETETSPTSETTVPESTYGTLRSTQKTYEYTTYSGVKWWDITGNTNTGTDDYDDWFDPDKFEYENETVAAVPSEAVQ